MPTITQNEVLAKIIPRREGGVYKASVPSTEILAYKYCAALPLPTDTFSGIIEGLQTETRTLFASKSPNTPKPPSTNSFSNCNGRWAEYIFAATAWNKLAEINLANQQIQADVIYVFVKLPDYKGSDTKWTNIFCDTLKTEISTFDRGPDDQDVLAAGHRLFTLYASNPDAVILKYTNAEFAALHLSLQPTSSISGLCINNQIKMDKIFREVGGTVIPSKNIVAFISMKNSLRPDRRYQFVREGDNVKAHLMYLKNRRADTITSFANKFYAVSFNKLSQADETITDIASTACVASGLVEPIWSVDKLCTCITVKDCIDFIQMVVDDNI